MNPLLKEEARGFPLKDLKYEIDFRRPRNGPGTVSGKIDIPGSGKAAIPRNAMAGEAL